jgi:hypothetical protein
VRHARLGDLQCRICGLGVRPSLLPVPCQRFAPAGWGLLALVVAPRQLFCYTAVEFGWLFYRHSWLDSQTDKRFKGLASYQMRYDNG